MGVEVRFEPGKQDLRKRMSRLLAKFRTEESLMCAPSETTGALGKQWGIGWFRSSFRHLGMGTLGYSNWESRLWENQAYRKRVSSLKGIC